jgi:hypothetical protein
MGRAEDQTSPLAMNERPERRHSLQWRTGSTDTILEYIQLEAVVFNVGA